MHQEGQSDAIHCLTDVCRYIDIVIRVGSLSRAWREVEEQTLRGRGLTCLGHSSEGRL